VIIDAFIVVVIGGLGSMSGAFVGAMLIGMMQSLARSSSAPAASRSRSSRW